MNETLTVPATTRADSPGGLYQRLVLDALGKMTAACLRIELPDGAAREIGTPGAEVSAVIRVRDAAFFKRCVLFGDVGFGESYVDGDWDTDSLERVIAWAILNVENSPSMSGSKSRAFALNLLKFYNRALHLLRPNSVGTARRNISEHYDLGNDFYRLWLDPTMTYSSAYFTAPGQNLETAQTAKYDALCRKLRLAPGDHVLEIGSGWGGFACHAVRNFGCRVTTVTISVEQFNYARERFLHEGIADRVDIRLEDYRRLTGTFDKIVSIEMMEALGDRYLETYCAKLHSLLKPDGLIGLQYITVPDNRHAELRRDVDWIQKHIFPGSLLLSVGRVNQALNRTGDLFLHHLEDLGLSYARTLRAWFDTFNARLAEVRALGFDGRFIRKWNYYLQYCEAAFAMRNISVVQAIYTRPNNPRLRSA
ncbi:MAG: cyclopropane-fatty-acyl-phospholipid synthase family protein [Chthoniobacteraceae bacterium]